jgi:hypothetical protein
MTTQEQPSSTEQNNTIEITKARSRVTTNTPCQISRNPSQTAKSPPAVLNVLAEMKNSGLSDYSTHFTDKALTYISKHADLNQPERVKQFIANPPCLFPKQREKEGSS